MTTAVRHKIVRFPKDVDPKIVKRSLTRHAADMIDENLDEGLTEQRVRFHHNFKYKVHFQFVEEKEGLLNYEIELEQTEYTHYL